MYPWPTFWTAFLLLGFFSAFSVDGRELFQHGEVAHRPRADSPRVDSSSASMQVDPVPWQLARESGQRNLDRMHGKPCFPSESQFGAIDLQYNRWRVSETALRPESVAKYPELLVLVLGKLHILPNDRRQYPITYIDHEDSGFTANAALQWYSRTSGHFYNILEPTYGVIISVDNVSPLTTTGNDVAFAVGGFHMPPLHRFSDLIAIAWSENVAKKKEQGIGVRPLRYWIRLVRPGSLTRRVMQDITSRKTKTKVDRHLPEPPQLGGKKDAWRFALESMNLDGEYARILLGTPHGNGVVWTLATNAHLLDGRRVVTHVTMFRLRPYYEDGNHDWGLLFEIADLRHNSGGYASAVQLGQANQNLMDGIPVLATPNPWKAIALRTNGWKLTPRDPSGRDAVTSGAIVTLSKHFHITLTPGETTGLYAYLTPTQYGHYYSVVNFESGVIISLKSRSPEEAQVADDKVIIPQLHRFDEVVPLAYSVWMTMKQKSPQDRPLRYWMMPDIESTSATGGIMSDIAHEDRQEDPPQPPGWRFTVDEEHGKALLGTDHGYKVSLSLATNPKTFGRSRRRVTHVSMFLTSKPGNPWIAGLLFEIHDVPSDTLSIAMDEGLALYNRMKGPGFPETNPYTRDDFVRYSWKISGKPTSQFGEAQGEAYRGRRWPGPFIKLFDPFHNYESSPIFVDQMKMAVGSHNSHYYSYVDVTVGVIVSIANVSPDDFRKTHPNVPMPRLGQFADIMGVVYSDPWPGRGKPLVPLKVWAFPISAGSLAYEMMEAIITKLRVTERQKAPKEWPGWTFSTQNDENNQSSYAHALLTTPQGRDVVDALLRNEHYFVGRRIVASVRMWKYSKYEDWFLAFYMEGLKTTRKRPASQELPHRGPGEGSSRHGPKD